ncbi:TRIM71 [Mytilus coruscus]|uniref:TRIM71 n=1 Tax=Mytilus coruscus TaxID=42192 RepID=A0A6J8CHF1_MYTCO|nr:TRIM71 [Mytilus coruscus]
MSNGKAQTLAVCQFCEESSEIKWKCINCELFLCQLCSSKIHSKSKASMKHEIINFKRIETEDVDLSLRKMDLGSMVCTMHSEQKCFVYCKDCSQPVCSKCLTETHKLHDYKGLDEAYNDIVSEKKELLNKLESNLQFLRNAKDKLNKILSDGDKTFQETKEAIKQTEKEMKEAITKYANDLLQELEAKSKSSENMIKAELSAMKKNEDKLEARINNINQAKQYHQVADIFSPLTKYPVKKIKHNGVKFIPGNMHKKLGSQSVLGDLNIVPDLELIHSYQSAIQNVTNIIFSSDNCAFIGSYSSQKLQKVKFENHRIKVEREIKIKIYDMAKTRDGEILVSSEGSEIKLYTKDGQLNTFKSFSPLKTLGIHITKDHKIIIGLTESLKIPATKDSIRTLVIMNHDCYIQNTIEFESLLTYPYRIQSFSDRILVVDITNTEWEGRVVMLDERGKLHWTYNGCNSINSDQDHFYPDDIAITSTDMILVSDCENHTIHVLNPDGKVIVCKDVKCLGIELPLGLCIDKNQVLWIRCNTYAKDKFSKAKISCVKLT